MALHRIKGLALTSAALLAVTCVGSAHAQATENNVSHGIRLSSDMGAVEPSSAINITVRLKLANQSAFDSAVDALYDPSSPTYHKWMTVADLKKYAPTDAQMQTVRKELESHGLTILSTDPNGFSIRARGTAANVAGAFHTELHQFRNNGKTFRANITNARLSGEAGNYVSTVAGLENHTARPLLVRALDPRTHKPFAPVPLKSAGADFTELTTTNCIQPAASTTLQYGGVLPVGVYYGNLYNSLITCDYRPDQLQAAYRLTKAYNQGLDGTGQTIVLVEAYGYPTIQSDANNFSSRFGLPALTSSNFSIVYPQGPPSNPNAGVETGWDGEIALDVDWAHAMAPGAKIVVVVASGQDSEDFQDAINYVVSNKLGYAVSNSWEVDTDAFAGQLEQTSWDQVLELATAQGISVNFATGDNGDNGLGTPVGAPGVPSVSPHATAVGGTAILNQIGSTTNGTYTVGWGDTVTYLAQGSVVLDPPQPLSAGFLGGAGGGESIFFPKPSWQKSLPGTGRQTPDVSALADPYTGVPVVLTSGGIQNIQYGNGGTSLASPIFTAFWAIANQNAGHPLGQAARTVAALAAKHSTLIQDVLPTTPYTITNPSGLIVDQNGSTPYSSTGIFGDDLLEGNTQFTSVVWPLIGGDTVVDFGFGIDSSLTVGPGWDNVTGYGTPNGLTFINAAAGK